VAAPFGGLAGRRPLPYARRVRSIHAAVFAIGLLSCGDRATPPTPTTSSGARAPSAAASSRPETSAASSAPAPSATAADARPLYFDKSIEPADLDGRSLRELSLMRNTIYARAGNSFRRPWLDAYFRAQSWYAPKDAIDASKITALDKENARKIGDYDASLTREQLEKMRDAVVARKAAGKATPDDAIELSPAPTSGARAPAASRRRSKTPRGSTLCSGSRSSRRSRAATSGSCATRSTRAGAGPSTPRW